MKIFYQVIIITYSLVSVMGLAACTQTPQTSPTVSPTADAGIPVSLPLSADVELKKGDSKNGRLTEINSQKKQIKIELSGYSVKVDIANIKKVKFKPGAKIYSRGKLVIRGEDKAEAPKPETWTGIPLSDFQLQNPDTGEAQVKLTASGIEKQKLRGIEAVAQDSTYVVQEMEFQPTGKMSLKVTPVDGSTKSAK